MRERTRRWLSSRGGAPDGASGRQEAGSLSGSAGSHPQRSGRASPEQRARAFGNAGLSQPLDGLLGKVATQPTQVTDADFAAARAAGFSEDELFELVICAAVGQSARLYDAGLAGLADAVAVAGEEEEGNAP
jgi:hypothetical protein